MTIFNDDSGPHEERIDARLAALVRGFREAVFLFDESGTIEYANAAARQAFDSDAQRGQNMRRILDLSGEWSELATEPPFDVELVRSDDSVFQGQVCVCAIDVDGSPAGFAALIRDHTHTHNLERKFVEAQRLEAAGALAAGIAHDFNNILMGINGTITLAERELGATHPVRERIDEVREAVDAAATISRQLLAFTRRAPESDRLFDVDGVILRMRSLFQTTVGDNVRLKFDLRAAGLHVAGDRRQLQQAVLNLVINAKDAIATDGEIAIETRAIELSDPIRRYDRTLQQGQYVKVSVTDDGGGIPFEHIDKVFEPFFTTKQLGRGTGLGLSMVYGTARGMGGLIDVESAVGRGTRFDLLLPAVAVMEGSLDEPISTGEYLRATPQPQTILVVEDNPLVARTVELFLHEDGHEVVVAHSLAAATSVAMQRAADFDVLVCDAVLSDGVASDVARLLRQCAPDIEIVFMSAHPRSVLLDHGRILPGYPCLHKPFDADELRRALADADASQQLERTTRAQRHVLLVDDHGPSVAALATVLSDAGFRVSKAASCAQARRVWDDQHPDVLVTDLRLPDGSGADIAREFLSNNPELRVFYASGLSRSTAVYEHDLPADIDYLEKPFDIDALCARLEQD